MPTKTIEIGGNCGENVTISAKQIQYGESASLIMDNNQEVDWYSDGVSTNIVPADPTYVSFTVLKSNLEGANTNIHFELKCNTVPVPPVPPAPVPNPTGFCASYQANSLIEKAAYGYYLLKETFVDGKKVYEKEVTNELLSGSLEFWVMRWQWNQITLRWNLYKMEGNVYISGILSVSNTSDLIGTTDNLGTLSANTCDCTIACFNSNVLLEGNGSVVSSPSTLHKRYTLDYNYLFESRETWQSYVVAGDRLFGYRWRLNGGNWQLMRRLGGILGSELLFNTLADTILGTTLTSQNSVAGYQMTNSTTQPFQNCASCV